MAKPTYRDLLLDPRWQKMRLKKLEAAEWRCEQCYCEETTLSVHHKRYVKGRQPWEYPEHELVVLCQPCHQAEHEAKELRFDIVACLHADGPAGVDDFFAVASGYVENQTNDPFIPAAVARIAADHPYAVEAGRMLATLMRHHSLTLAGMQQVSAWLEARDGNAFAAELDALLSKHGLKARRGTL